MRHPLAVALEIILWNQIRFFECVREWAAIAKAQTVHSPGNCGPVYLGFLELYNQEHQTVVEAFSK